MLRPREAPKAETIPSKRELRLLSQIDASLCASTPLNESLAIGLVAHERGILEDGVEACSSQVEPRPMLTIRAPLLDRQLRDYPECLCISFKAVIGQLYQLIELFLGDVTKWRMPKVVSEASRLDYIRIQLKVVCKLPLLWLLIIKQALYEASTDLTHFEGVRQAVVQQVELAYGCNLGDTSKATECLGVEDPVAVELEGSSMIIMRPAARLPLDTGVLAFLAHLAPAKGVRDLRGPPPIVRLGGEHVTDRAVNRLLGLLSVQVGHLE